ncbi:sulfate ABC transporter permease subunit CysW [Synechococcus sp. PCC 6312]|uniref:sulfate ABC transporter permease subunit CysW n=1 Tax=Synechococcus sp. (strain ATCC 27167 / PCC 6312) TaxID=195253 RepID=UPI00029F01CE|nr:sulfate ABC transporter permease subunit CysW [Synechococcus sp. PCC 6312]AFY59719.1 sulfate ABC transporter, permease protein CysW [Synechococcus sp. PCC 6312]
MSSNKPVSSPNSQRKSWVPIVLILIAVGYVALVLLIPAANVFYQAFSKGFGPFLDTLKLHDFQVAVGLTVGLALIAVPVNTFFGLCAAWALARKRFPGRTLILSIIDLPFSISPVVAGLMIVLVYGRVGWLGPWLLDHNIQVVFAFPGMVLATIFVSLPFVAREVIPVLEEVGPEQEEAAKILGANEWQTFWRVTLPNIRWGLLYGVLLTNARAMGEFGAVAVVSGNIAGKTQSLPLFVEEAYKNYQTESAYGAAVILGLLAVFTLVVQELLERRTRIKEVE